MRLVPLAASLVMTVCFAVPSARALPSDAWTQTSRACSIDAPRPGPWSIEFGPRRAALTRGPLAYLADGHQAAPVRRTVPVEYSNGYKTRAQIHKIASFATLPLFVANYIVGQDLYNNHDESKKGLHAGLAASTGVLFGVNTFTGAWNLWEGRKDPNHRTKRMTHGILMMAADVGFLATAMLAPESEEHEHFEGPSSGGGPGTHRAVALTSMGIATVSYLIMLLGGN